MCKSNVLRFVLLFSIITFINFCAGCSKDPLESLPGKGTWTKISQAGEDMNKIFFIDERTGWIAGTEGIIKYTSDGGYNWTVQSTGTTSNIESIYFLDRNTGVITGRQNAVLRTTNGGNAWIQCQVPDDEIAHYFSIHQCTEKLFFISNTGKIFSSGNSGFSWEFVSKINDMGLTYLYVYDSENAFVMQHMGSYIYKTSDGCKNWNKYKLPSLFMGDIFFIDDKTGWTCENFGPSSAMHDSTCIYLTSDGGESWNHLYTFKKWITFRNLRFVNMSEGWV